MTFRQPNLGDPKKATGTLSPRSWVGKITLRFWNRASANEEVQRLAIEAGKFLKLHHIYPPFAALALGDKRLRAAQAAGNINLGASASKRACRSRSKKTRYRWR